MKITFVDKQVGMIMLFFFIPGFCLIWNGTDFVTALGVLLVAVGASVRRERT